MKTRTDMSKPPSNCPNCNGEREWSGEGDGMATCYMCGLTSPARAGENQTSQRKMETIPLDGDGKPMVGCIYCKMFGICVIERKLAELSDLIRYHSSVDLYKVVGGRCDKFIRTEG